MMQRKRDVKVKYDLHAPKYGQNRLCVLTPFLGTPKSLPSAAGSPTAGLGINA